MKYEVKVTDASLDDVIQASFDEFGEEAGSVTLGDVVAQALLDRLTKDPRWGDIAQRFADAADAYLAEQAPGFVEGLVKAEVTRQLETRSRVSAVRGEPSTVAEAVVSTEVTTQLRAQFAPLVERALAGLARDLQALSGDAVEAFRKGTGR